MNIPLVDLKAQYTSIKGEIDRAIQEVIADAAFVNGKYTQEFEMNFAKFFRLGIGVHYRLVTGVNPDMHYSRLTNSDLLGPGAQVAVKYGWF